MNFADVRNGAVVVAHPDDETLWAGGLITSYPDRWTVICCSIPHTDPVRAWKFFAACETLGARARLLPWREPGEGRSLQNLDTLDLSGFDAVVTHNSAGEYGHSHHAQVHRFAVERAPCPVITFGFRPGALGAFALPLSETAKASKHRALRCYDHTSPTDGKPKWMALLERYAPLFDFETETYDVHRA